MYPLSPGTFHEYARAQPALADESWTARLLGGGVSNVVMLAESAHRRLVFKQALGQLRVAEEWLADRTRIHRESASMRRLAPLLPYGAIPAVVFEDRDAFIYAMIAAPPEADDWKMRLLRAEADESVARQAAAILNALIRTTGSEWRDAFGSQHCFDQLRLDPYYRFTAQRHPDLREAFEEAIALAQRPLAMVHGDFSPKNILVDAGRAVLIDFEAIHYGDPAFDAAFLLNHLLLKAAHGVAGARALGLAFWRALAPPDATFERDTIRHLGCLHLARVDGKSPAEYLTEDKRTQVRAAARAIIVDPPKTIQELFV